MKIYKIRNIGNFVVMAVLIMLSYVAASAQETVTIPLSDLKQFQKTAAEREFYKSAYEDSLRKAASWQQSASDWKKLYESEKLRADEVQGGRIAELLKANSAYKDQAALDKQRLGELEFTVRKVKAQRRWWLAVGFGGGLYGGYKLGKINF